MDAKTTYSNSVDQAKINAQSDNMLAGAIERGEKRKEKYRTEWQEVDINELFERFNIDPLGTLENGKITYKSRDNTLAIITDIGGGYCRIEDITATTEKRQYLDINGKPAYNYTDAQGKQHGRSSEEFNAATHFLIKKRRNLK